MNIVATKVVDLENRLFATKEFRDILERMTDSYSLNQSHINVVEEALDMYETSLVNEVQLLVDIAEKRDPIDEYYSSKYN